MIVQLYPKYILSIPLLSLFPKNVFHLKKSCLPETHCWIPGEPRSAPRYGFETPSRGRVSEVSAVSEYVFEQMSEREDLPQMKSKRVTKKANFS